MNPYINPNFSGVTTGGQYGSMKPYQSTQLSPSVDATKITSQQNVSLPNITPSVIPPISSIPSIESITTTAPTVTETNNTELQKRLLDALKGQGQKVQFQAEAEQSQGLPQFKTQLNDINSQIKQLQAETQMKTLQMEQDAAGRGQTTAGLAPLTASVERTNTIKALGLSSIAQTLQGNIALGQQLADKAVEARFAPIQNEIDYLKTALEMNESNLTKEEKKRANEQKIKLDERQRLLDQQKSDAAQKNNLIVEAAKNGAPADLLNKALTSSSSIDTITTLSGYLADPLIRQQKLLEVQKTQAEISKLLSGSKGASLGTDGKVLLPLDDAQKVNKEVVTNDAYKAIRKGQDSLAALSNFETLFNDTGATSAVFSPRENAKLKAKYNATILNLKEFFNLGVLNGPDEAILRSVLPDPTNSSAVKTIGSLGISMPAANTKAGLESMKNLINQTLDDRYSSIESQYSAYSKDSVTSLADLNRIYVEQKKKLDPKVAKLVAENPSYTD